MAEPADLIEISPLEQGLAVGSREETTNLVSPVRPGGRGCMENRGEWLRNALHAL